MNTKTVPPNSNVMLAKSSVIMPNLQITHIIGVFINELIFLVTTRCVVIQIRRATANCTAARPSRGFPRSTWEPERKKGRVSGHTFSREAHTKSPMPRRAPEGLSGSARQGRGRDAARFRRARTALPKTPLKPFGAQDISGIGVAFSLDTFFWPRKRKYRGCRSANRR